MLSHKSRLASKNKCSLYISYTWTFTHLSDDVTFIIWSRMYDVHCCLVSTHRHCLFPRIHLLAHAQRRRVVHEFVMRATVSVFAQNIKFELIPSMRAVDWFKNVLFIENEFRISRNELWFQVHINRLQCSNRIPFAIHSTVPTPTTSTRIWDKTKSICYFIAILLSHSLTFVSIFCFRLLCLLHLARVGKKQNANAKSFWTQWISFKILFQCFFLFVPDTPVVGVTLSASARIRLNLNAIWNTRAGYHICKWKAKYECMREKLTVARVHTPCYATYTHRNAYLTSPRQQHTVSRDMNNKERNNIHTSYP